MTPSSDTSHGVCYVVPERVIPVIFVPGVMGSNLIGTGKDNAGETWLVNSAWSMRGWLSKGPEARKRILQPDAMKVYDGGALPEGTDLPDEELKRRHWGEIAAKSYKQILAWLENSLNDFGSYNEGERLKLLNLDLGALTGEKKPTREQVGLTYRYRFPVYACGYNWLASNADGGERLSDRIDEIIGRYRQEKKPVDKVIIVTHSMGGLVGRHCSEVLGRNKDIFGIVHGVMPAIGAAAVYRRFKAGTETPETSWYDLIGPLINSATAGVLGSNAAEMTAVLSSAPGPLQLLPTPEYGNGWLRIKDNDTEYRFPVHGDPYSEIYTVRGKWWSMCEDRLIDPRNKTPDAEKHRLKLNEDWERYAKLIKVVKSFHGDISNLYHPNTYAFIGNSNEHKAYGNVTWAGGSNALDSWLVKGDRKAETLDAQSLDAERPQLGKKRSVEASLSGRGWFKHIDEVFTISKPDEAGDGTVPLRSGVAVKKSSKSLLEVGVEHEPAFDLYKGDQNLRAAQFTLRAIVLIAQDVQKTRLRYAG